MTFFFHVDNRENGDSVKIKVGLDLEDIACLRAGGQQLCVDNALRGLCTRGTPRPRSIIAVTGQFDIDAPRHGALRYCRGAVSPMPNGIFAANYGLAHGNLCIW